MGVLKVYTEELTHMGKLIIISQLTTQYQVPLISNIDLHINVKETESDEMVQY
jgi:hypothetical protein